MNKIFNTVLFIAFSHFAEVDTSHAVLSLQTQGHCGVRVDLTMNDSIAISAKSIIVKASITNYETYDLKIASQQLWDPERYVSADIWFEVEALNNVNTGLPNAKPALVDYHSMGSESEVKKLRPGETITSEYEIGQFFHRLTPGLYRVRITFRLSILNEDEKDVYSNWLKFQVK